MKAVVFDLDGTLLNRDASLIAFVEHQYHRLEKFLDHIPKEQYINRFITLDNHGYTWKDKVYTQLITEFNIQHLSTEQLLADYIQQFQHHCIAFPNLVKLFQQLKQLDIKLGIITNGIGQFQMSNIQALGIDLYVDTILISEWEGIKKPDAEIFIRALHKLHVTADESVFVGDHPINDVQAAQLVGMTSIWKSNSQWQDVQADFIINDLLEIIPIVKMLK
ncbi:HAD family hydrolase [Lysinibacillus piscis]|uniref:Haloacid dehalogenase n=1 Tax=Lysinibacillus piscis TaxID=2518931 RepID=A0ABQ5NPM5_9BACI|nr:HAD family hydrolase [Lysinibacillus sp. KH24]GLC90272.1 haloacid dehalogenase [Lysinibacillus sp. KH24]